MSSPEAKSIMCPRHGRTQRLYASTRLCGEKRSRFDTESEGPETKALREALGMPPEICGRAPLDECPECRHPTHTGGGCSTILAQDNDGTKWCACGRGS